MYSVSEQHVWIRDIASYWACTGHALPGPCDIGCYASVLNPLHPPHKIAHCDQIPISPLFCVRSPAVPAIVATLAHFAYLLVNIHINTTDIGVALASVYLPLSARVLLPEVPQRMRHRPRILSFPGAVIAFCKTLRLPSATNRRPRYTTQKTLAASPTQVKTPDLEIDDSTFGRKGHSEDTVGHDRSLESDVTSSSPSLDMQARSKSPLSMISCPILEHWNLAALEVCRSLAQYELIIYLLINRAPAVPKPIHALHPQMKHQHVCLMKTRGIPLHIL